MATTADGNYLTEQAATQVSANDYIGKSIYNSANESIGDVNDPGLEKKRSEALKAGISHW